MSSSGANGKVVTTAERGYRLLLRAYPTDFQRRFATEMAQVFRSLCIEAYERAGTSGVMGVWLATMWDWVWAAMVQWARRLFTGRMESMAEQVIERRDGLQPLSALQAGMGALPFLMFGISSMVSKVEYFQARPAGTPFWLSLLVHPYLVFNWLNLIGLGVGIVKGFPRWAYSFLGWAVLFGWWWSDMGFYGHTMDWRIWLPLAGVILAALFIRRSLAPLQALLRGLWSDWTLLSLGVYILYEHVFVLFDENHHPQLLELIAISTLAACAGAWGYYRARSPLRRVLALVGGLLAAALIGEYSYATWDYRAYYGLPEGGNGPSLVGLIAMAVLGLLMVGNGLAAAWRQRRHSSLNEK